MNVRGGTKYLQEYSDELRTSSAEITARFVALRRLWPCGSQQQRYSACLRGTPDPLDLKASPPSERLAGCYAIFEHLNMGGRANAERSELMGAQLARMHRSLSPNGKYGFHVDNTCGGMLSC